MDIDAAKFRAAVLAELLETGGWVDGEEVTYLLDHPEEPLSFVIIDASFDFGSLWDKLNK